MASRKKSDGGAARAAGRKRVQNKRQEAKYGLQGFTAQANRNLRQPKIDRPQDIAMAGFGVGAGFGGVKAAQVTGRAVAKSGFPARVVNRLTGQKVVVHASPQTGLRQIEPRLGSNQMPQQSVVFGWDPLKKGSQNQITRSAGKYVAKEPGQQAGSVYVAKVKKRDIVTPPKLASSGQVVSSSPAKVVREIPVSGKTFSQVDNELQRFLRTAGAPAKPDVPRSVEVFGKAKSKVRKTFMTPSQKAAQRRRKSR